MARLTQNSGFRKDQSKNGKTLLALFSGLQPNVRVAAAMAHTASTDKMHEKILRNSSQNLVFDDSSF